VRVTDLVQHQLLQLLALLLLLLRPLRLVWHGPLSCQRSRGFSAATATATASATTTAAALWQR